MKGIQGPGMVPPNPLLIAPIHLGLVTGGRFEADMGVDRAQWPQRPDQPLHNGVGAGEAVMDAQGAIDAGGQQPRRSDQPLFNQRSKRIAFGGPQGAPVDRRLRQLQVFLARPSIQAHEGVNDKLIMALPPFW